MMLDKILNYYGYYKQQHILDGIKGKVGPMRDGQLINVNKFESEFIYDIRISKYEFNGFRHNSNVRLSEKHQESAFWEHGYHEAWCEQNCHRDWIKYENDEYYIFSFTDKSDAGTFKMGFK